ncbi:MAG: helix-turn-helix transcriptional regulator [Nannocystaceae bacterium]
MLQCPVHGVYHWSKIGSQSAEGAAEGRANGSESSMTRDQGPEPTAVTSSNPPGDTHVLSTEDIVRISAEVGLIMKQTRVSRRMSLMKLSQVTGVSRRSIRVMERGDGAVPSLGTILKVSRALGMSFVEVAEAIERPWSAPHGPADDGDLPGTSG